jgi:hypothetical protein
MKEIFLCFYGTGSTTKAKECIEFMMMNNDKQLSSLEQANIMLLIQ